MIWGVAWELVPGGAAGDADSYWVSVDGGETAKWHYGCINQTQNRWTYSRFSDMPENDCVISCAIMSKSVEPKLSSMVSTPSGSP